MWAVDSREDPGRLGCAPLWFSGEEPSSTELTVGMCMFGGYVTKVWPIRASHPPGPLIGSGMNIFPSGSTETQSALQWDGSDERGSVYEMWSYGYVIAPRLPGERACLRVKYSFHV